MNEPTYRNELPFILKGFEKAFQSCNVRFDDEKPLYERKKTDAHLAFKFYRV